MTIYHAEVPLRLRGRGYLAHCLKLLKDDNRAIFTAAAKASEAVAYLKRLQPA
jgi:antirestriction protein ArdC